MDKVLRRCRRPLTERRLFVFAVDGPRRIDRVIDFFGDRRPGAAPLMPRLKAWALAQAYASLPRHNFSETVLQAGLPFLSVSALPPLTWSDLGTPQRLFKLLQALEIAPPWMRGRRPTLPAVQRAG